MSTTSSSYDSYSSELFETFDITFDTAPSDPAKRITIHGVKSKNPDDRKPPLLLIHGHPQTHHIWHKVAPILIEHYTLIIPDLRGHGDSSKPNIESDRETHEVYSKRSMADDQVATMKHFGFEKYYVVGHDRGGRVGHRLAVDHPDKVLSLIVLDIAPTLAMYEKADQWFAKYYWHWFWLIQPYPLPEEFLQASPETYISRMTAGGDESIFSARALSSYKSNFSSPDAIHAMCEDYRASGPGGIDLIRDAEDRKEGRRIKGPFKVLWGEKGIIEKCFDAIGEWGVVCEQNVKGRSVDTGHYIPEEMYPAALAKEIHGFFEYGV